jgi:hypothetical protein
MSHDEVVETWLTELAIAPRHRARREQPIRSTNVEQVATIYEQLEPRIIGDSSEQD